MIDPDALIDTLYSYGHDGEYVEDNTEIRISCPLCADEKKRLYIEAETGTWICFRCDERGDLFDLFHRVVGLNPHEAFEIRRKLRQHGEPEYQFTVKKLTPVRQISLPPTYVPIDVDTWRYSPYALYLAGRGIDIPLALTYDIGYCETGPYAGRVIVPVSYKDTLYTFVARSIDPAVEKKILTPPGGRPGATLFNAAALYTYRDAGPAIIVEGVFDALRMYDRAVAVLGSHISLAQVELLARLGRSRQPFVVMMDSDEAGRKASRSIMKTLFSHMLPAVEARLPDGLDPGSASEEVLHQAIGNALRETEIVNINA